jgi:ZIP family zinc transporter
VTAVLYTLIPVIAALGGAIFAAVSHPSERLQTNVQHFAAGIIFAAAALELLPPVREQPPIVAIIGFLAGIATMVASRRLSQKLDERNGGARVSGLIVASAIDVLIDGVILGATFTMSARQGILLTIALALGVLFLGLSVAVTLRQAEVSQGRIIAMTGGIALAMPVGTAIGVTTLRNVTAPVLATVLAFGAVVLMYLVTEELLVRAHRVKSSPWAMPLFFGAFLLYLVIEELMG